MTRVSYFGSCIFTLSIVLHSGKVILKNIYKGLVSSTFPPAKSTVKLVLEGLVQSGFFPFWNGTGTTTGLMTFKK